MTHLISDPPPPKKCSVFASSCSSKKWVVKVQTCRNQDNPNRIFSFYCVRKTANFTWVLQEVLKLSRKVLKLTPEPFMLSNLDLKTNTQFTTASHYKILISLLMWPKLLEWRKFYCFTNTPQLKSFWNTSRLLLSNTENFLLTLNQVGKLITVETSF